MTYRDLLRRLRDRKALIVHFSHHANMREGGAFPEDLRAAAMNSRLWALSCSVVWPTHAMALPGSVGLVLRPRSLASIVGVSAGDGGYSTLSDGRELGGGDALDEGAFDRSLGVPIGGYNEWRVRESDVVGVYVEFSEGLLYAKRQILTTDPDTGTPLSQDIAMQQISVGEVHDAFPDLPVYTRNDGRITATNIPASVIYPWSLTSGGV